MARSTKSTAVRRAKPVARSSSVLPGKYSCARIHGSVRMEAAAGDTGFWESLSERERNRIHTVIERSKTDYVAKFVDFTDPGTATQIAATTTVQSPVSGEGPVDVLVTAVTNDARPKSLGWLWMRTTTLEKDDNYFQAHEVSNRNMQIRTAVNFYVDGGTLSVADAAAHAQDSANKRPNTEALALAGSQTFESYVEIRRR